MTDQSTEQDDRQAKLTAAYGAATRRLRENHLDEFNNLRVEEAKARGIEWSPKLTAEQKAAEEVQRLLQEFPGLTEKIGREIRGSAA